MAKIGEFLKESGFGAGLLAMPAVQAIQSGIDRYKDKREEKKRKEAMGIPDAGDPETTMRKGGKVKKMKSGGYVRSADGCAQRGKTKGRFV